jgi:hypothetical protein
MYLKGATFNEYVGELGLARAEGLLLRYLSQTYKALVQSVPDHYKTDEVLDIIAYLRTMLSRVDTSLIDEWESLFGDEQRGQFTEERTPSRLQFDPRVNHKAFVAKVRSELFHLVRLLAQKNYEDAGLAVANRGDDAWTPERFSQALSPFYEDYQQIIATPQARNSTLTKLEKLSDTTYSITHTLLDDKEDNIWFINALIDLDKQREEYEPLLFIQAISS